MLRSMRWVLALAASQALGNTAPPALVGINLAPLGNHPTTGVEHAQANTLVFLDLFKHATPFTRYQYERDAFDGLFAPEYSAARAPTWAEPGGYPSLLPSEGSSWRIAVKATIGWGGDSLPFGRYVHLVNPSWPVYSPC